MGKLSKGILSSLLLTTTNATTDANDPFQVTRCNNEASRVSSEINFHFEIFALCEMTSSVLNELHQMICTEIVSYLDTGAHF